MNITLADSRIEEFATLVRTGLEAWYQAGLLLCRLLDESPQARPEILKAVPDLTDDILEAFLRIGRRELHPALVIDDSPGARRLATLPYLDQVRLHGAKVMVVVTVSGGTVQREKSIRDLTPKEAARVSGADGIRTPTEQERYLLAQRGSRQPGCSARSQRSPDALPIEVEAIHAEHLDDDPRDALKRHLASVQAGLLEVRSLMIRIHGRELPQDQYITNALNATGFLRVAFNEGKI